ncbi:MAG: hypothetical protein KGZ71_06520 [Desulfobulbaceae bacterium]|nr:hypothetical protein [Candidatus Kapabacteria bacterium]MBS4000118.1 hypothetical protein [Desulfobulbaceae bacterium]
MRVTHKSTFIPYQRNLDEIQNRKFKEEIRLSTGKDITSLSDNPSNFVDAKMFSSKIAQNDNYYNIIQDSLSELRAVEESLEFISDNVRKIRELAIDATQIGNSGNAHSLSVFIKGIMEDILKQSNVDFNGKYLFSGTKTTPESMADAPENNKVPFELKKVPPTAENPSGMELVFHGNFKDRIINKDGKTTEIINTKADDIFGEDFELFDSILELYNLLAFKADGTPRQEFDNINTDDFDKLNILQKKLADYTEKIDKANGENGAKINRLELIADQTTSETIRLKEYRSIKEDTDVARTAVNLQMEEIALRYSLQVGSSIMRNSLFDFLR